VAIGGASAPGGSELARPGGGPERALSGPFVSVGSMARRHLWRAFWQGLGIDCDGPHRIEREHPPALQLPALVLLQQNGSHQASDGGVVGEDAHNAGAALGFLSVVKPLQRRWPSAAGPRPQALMQACHHWVGLHGRLGPG
jgi:hypothetical protein